MKRNLNLIKSEFLNEYNNKCKIDLVKTFDKLVSKNEFTLTDFDYYLFTSSLYSSKIEGNSLDINSFFRMHNNKNYSRRKEVKEIENLTSAYKFAAKNKLTKKNVLEAHGILSKTLVTAKEQGVIRKEQIAVWDSRSKKSVYMAVEPQYVNAELLKLFEDIETLLKEKLSINEVFYYASMIHIWFAKIHPFTDGNGRTVRLVEKWFIVSKLGLLGWAVRSEIYYWDHKQEYYQNIALGYNYYVLHWERCIAFLLMLPEALKESLK